MSGCVLEDDGNAASAELEVVIVADIRSEEPGRLKSLIYQF
jgi:hypothetical protein